MSPAILIRVVLGASLAFAGCNPRESAGPGANRPRLNLLTWNDYVDPGVLARFEAETGIEVVYHAFENPDEMKGLLQAFPNRYDLVITGSEDLCELRDQQLLQPLDPDRLAGMDQLDPRLAQLISDPDFSLCLPYLWGSFNIASLPGAIPEDTPASLGLIFGGAAIGEILLIDDMVEVFMFANLYRGKPASDFSERTMEETATFLETFVATHEVSFCSEVEIIQALTEGTCAVALTYSGDTAFAAEDNPEVRRFPVGEGAPVWIDIVIMSPHAPNPAAAYQFLNYLLNPEVIAAISNYNWYPNGNLASSPWIDPELRDDPILVPDLQCTTIVPYPQLAGETADRLAQMTHRIRSAASRRAGSPELASTRP